MKRVLALILTIVLSLSMVAMFASCGNYTETNEKIKIGICTISPSKRKRRARELPAS